MLDRKLEEYAKSGIYPFHMPGHKRIPLLFQNPYAIDITEIDGFDNLYHAEGILKEAQERAAQLYGAKKSYYLVNGSTGGILAAVSAAVSPGGKILMARNSHKSAYHAAYLRRLSAVFLNPCVTGFGILGAISPKEVEEKLLENPDAKAVLITSPTYEGVASDIAAIAEIVHGFGIPLIVDEAHGAHFGFHPFFPQTAARLGADLAIQSMHKVLPSLTQTALLHFQSEYVPPEAVERYLSIYQTSSPSYVLMAGMERCIRLLSENGRTLFDEFAMQLRGFYQKTQKFSHLRVMQRKDFSKKEAFALDPSKIVISAKYADMDGDGLLARLLADYKIQMEMSFGFYALGMSSIMDGEEGFGRLYRALLEMDEKAHFAAGAREDADWNALYAKKEKRMEMHEAMERPRRRVSFDEAVGKISGSMACLYPPGIPILLPGETIDGDFIKNIRKCVKFRRNLQGIADIIRERIDIVNG